MKSFRLDDLSMEFSDGQRPGKLCSRSRAFLNEQGLLFRGFHISGKEAEEV